MSARYFGKVNAAKSTDPIVLHDAALPRSLAAPPAALRSNKRSSFAIVAICYYTPTLQQPRDALLAIIVLNLASVCQLS
jgi:hypothetical protein